MKAILLSIRPEWIAKILNGEKTIELRKVFPKDYVGWVYIYVTKGKPKHSIIYRLCKILNKTDFGCIGGKVVARFWCDRIDTHHILPTENILPFNKNVEQKLKQLCLTKEQVMNYGKGEDYYAHLIYISKLEIFDRPKELSEFYRLDKSYNNSFGWAFGEEEKRIYLNKAAQNYLYIDIGDIENV